MNPSATRRPTDHLDFSAAHDALDDALAHEIDALHSTLSRRQLLFPVADELAAFLKQPGKRIRPLLFLAAHGLLAPKAERGGAPLEIACALELFHAFILIHDDIVDQSDQRRGRPCLHQCLTANGSPQGGEAAALVLGDIVYAWANTLFLRSVSEPRRALAALRYHLEIARDTGIGELMDIMHSRQTPGETSPDSVLETYYLKTTRYTFEAPLALAGILNGAQPEWFESAAQICRPLGTAFQLENDLHEVKKLACGHIAESEFREAALSLPIVRLAHRNQWNGTHADLLQALRKSETVDATRREVENLFAEADKALEFSPLPDAIREGLRRIIEFVKENRNPTAGSGVASQQFDQARQA